MKNALFFLVIIFSLGIASAMAADAPTATDMMPSMPTARPVYDESGAFGFCLADYLYADQRKFTVAMSPRDEINLGITVPKAGFKQGGKYDLTLAIGQTDPLKIRAVALNTESLLMQMGQTPDLAKTLSTATKISITAANGKAMDFQTPGTAAMLNGLRECNNSNKSKIRKEAGLPGPLQELLGTAGFKTIKIIPLDDIPPDQRPADFMWQVGPIMAGVRERDNSANRSLTELSGLHLDGLKKKCSGAFKADIDREQSAPGITMRTALARCVQKTPDGDHALVVAILFYTTAAKLFTTFTHEGEVQDEGAAIADRDRLRDTLLKLANEAGKPPKTAPKKGKK